MRTKEEKWKTEINVVKNNERKEIKEKEINNS